MIQVYDSLQKIVGMTPLIKLRSLSPEGGAKIWVKLEGGNPTGSYKDRMAVAVVQNALKRGDLKKGDTVVEYTGGSTGSALAFVCAYFGLKFIAISSDAFSYTKILSMKAFGADVLIENSAGLGITPELIERMKRRAYNIVSSRNAFYADQFGSLDVISGYKKMGYEISNQLNDSIDVFCASIGTAGALMGAVKGLNERGRKPKVFGFEPSQSPFLTTGKGGGHRIEGIGIGFEPPFLERGCLKDILTIDQEQAFKMCRELAQKEGLFCGTSTGANIVGAIKIAKSLGVNQNVVTLGCDTGLKYLEGELYASS